MSQPSPPTPPSPGQSFQQGIQTWLKYLPKLLSGEDKLRGADQFTGSEDQKRIQAQQALQTQFGPTQYGQQLQALAQLDPNAFAIREGFGNAIGGILGRGYVDPRQNALYSNVANSYGSFLNDQRGQYNRGASLDPSLQRDIEQTIAARQGATGNYLGSAPAMAAAVYAGQRGQQLQQQRTANYAGALQGAGGFEQAQTPTAGALAQAGGYLGLPTFAQQAQGIQAVTPDRSFGYENPNAGYQGQQFALQNYPNQYAGYNPTNPWMGALGGAATGAVSGAIGGSAIPGIGTGIGAIGGGLIGGLGGYFSSPGMKTNVKKVANVPIYEYNYKAKYGIPGTFRGPMSTDVKKHDPEAVTKVFGHDFVLSPNSLGLNRVKIARAREVED